MKVYAVVTFVGTDRETVHAYYADDTEACFHAEDLETVDEDAKVFVVEIEETGTRTDFDEVLDAHFAAKREP